MAKRIIPKTARLVKREKEAKNDLRALFPNGVVRSLDSEDKALGKRLSGLSRSLGYCSRAELIRALGFEMGYRSKGRPTSVDPETFFAELQRRYEGKPKVTLVGTIMTDNPDLVGNLKTVRNRCKELYGHSFGVELTRRGLLQRRGCSSGRTGSVRSHY